MAYEERQELRRQAQQVRRVKKFWRLIPSLLVLLSIVVLSLAVSIFNQRPQASVSQPTGTASATSTSTIAPSPTIPSTITPIIAPTAEPSPSLNPCEQVWRTGSNYEREVGYCWYGDHWVPGFLVNRAVWMKMPSPVWGFAAAYADGVMPNPGGDFVGGVSVPFCAEVGTSVWLKRQGVVTGPYKVVDCSRPVGLYTHVVDEGLVVEVDFQTYQNWGGVGAVVVSKSPNFDEPAIFIRDWFLDQDPFGLGR